MDQRPALTRRSVLRMGALTALAGLTSKNETAFGMTTIATVEAGDFEALLGQPLYLVSSTPEKTGFIVQVTRVQRHRQPPAEIGVQGIELRVQPFSVLFACNERLRDGSEELAWIEHPRFRREQIFIVAVKDKSEGQKQSFYQAVFN